MPFVRPPEEPLRIYPPTNLPGICEGDWIEISVTYTAQMRRRISHRAFSARLSESDFRVDLFAYREALLEEIVTAWSDASPVTPEALSALHPEVQDWIAAEFDRGNSRDEQEKKDSNGNSSPISAPDREPSLTSSATS